MASPGQQNILNEFISGRESSRAKARIEQLGLTGKEAPIERDARKAEMLVTAVKDWGGENTIGGEVAVIMLERRKKWRWFHRPAFCPPG